MMNFSQIAPLLARGWQTHCSTSGQAAITFDDGPDPKTTPLLLEALNKHGMKATMFVVGQRCKGNASILREMSEAGHSIACHGYAHERHWFRNSTFVQASVRQTMYMLQEFGIRMAPLFRPPFGAIDWKLHRNITALKVTPILWSAHVADWKPQDQSLLRQRLVRSVHDRMILLLHDGHDTTANLVEQLPYLREALDEQNLRAVALGKTEKLVSA